MRYLLAWFALLAPCTAGQDEYALPDAKHYVDVRHLRRAVGHLLAYEPRAAGGGRRDLAPGIGGSGRAAGGGSGWSQIGEAVVHKETSTSYYLLTAAHLVPRGRLLQFSYAGRRSSGMSFTILRHYPADDFAILAVAKTAWGNYPPPTVVPLGTYEDDIADEVLLYRDGRPTRTRTLDHAFAYLVVGARISPGHSGSPVFDTGGTKLLGLVLRLDGGCISHKQIRFIVEPPGAR